LFIYAPLENGGLGVKDNYIQFLIFKYRALLKGLNPHEDSPFLRAHNLAAKEIFISNNSEFLIRYRNYELFNQVERKLKFIPEFMLSNISLTHKTYFPENSFRNLIKIGCKDIGDVLEYKSNPSFALTPQQSRQIKIELSKFDESLSKIKKSVKSNVEFTELEMYDVIHESTWKSKKSNSYSLTRPKRRFCWKRKWWFDKHATLHSNKRLQRRANIHINLFLFSGMFSPFITKIILTSQNRLSRRLIRWMTRNPIRSQWNTGWG